MSAFQANAFQADAFQGDVVVPTITTGGSAVRKYRPVDIYALAVLATTAETMRIEAQTARDLDARAERERRRNAALLLEKMREQAAAQRRIRDEEWLLVEA